MTGPVRAARHATSRPTALLVVLLATGLGSLGWLVVLPAPAGAASKPCVGVVVDARLLGGDVRTGCAVGDPGSGFEALTKAGFSYAFVPRQPGLVCQVDRAPECTRTSTTTYWSYWYRAKGSQRWVYSSVGAGGHDPAPGSTEAWVWQDGGRRQPPDVPLTTICPQVAGEPAPTKTAKSPTAAASSARSSATTAATSPSHRTRRTTSPTPTASATPTKATASLSGPTSTAPTSSSPTTATSTTAPATSAAAAGSPKEPGSGEPPWTGLAVGGVLVAGLALAAFTRFRRSGSTP